MDLIDGPAGTVWTNGTGRILWQYQCQFRNSCGRCIQFAGRIGPWWPLPLHRRCNCRNIPVPPGEDASPFVDYRREVAELDAKQQAVVMGRSNYALVRAGKVDWRDVVHDRRILNFREVVAKAGLTVPELTKAGVMPAQAKAAFAAVHAPDIKAAEQVRLEFVRILKERGFDRTRTAAAVAGKLTARVGISGGPSGASGPLFRGLVGLGAAELAMLALADGLKAPDPPARPPLTPEEQAELDRVVLESLGFDLDAEDVEP